MPQCAGAGIYQATGDGLATWHATGFKTVLDRVAKVWRDNREAVLEQGADTIRQLQEFTEPQGAGGGMCWPR